ncbi:unnamed protein product [Oikopleura dioica]|uniref:Uncharacterized protein n=1 Tax=Oikopleura dioica TaxID=34765 RepID=E4WU39_OIKDI|nr:unnamed protein product [Oikopleura dioica]
MGLLEEVESRDLPHNLPHGRADGVVSRTRIQEEFPKASELFKNDGDFISKDIAIRRLLQAIELLQSFTRPFQMQKESQFFAIFLHFTRALSAISVAFLDRTETPSPSRHFLPRPNVFFNSAEPYGNKGNHIFARNHMAFDLGMPWLSENNEENILKALEQTFHMVLITDYFPESMVLLKTSCAGNGMMLFSSSQISALKKLLYLRKSNYK